LELQCEAMISRIVALGPTTCPSRDAQPRGVQPGPFGPHRQPGDDSPCRCAGRPLTSFNQHVVSVKPGARPREAIVERFLEQFGRPAGSPPRRRRGTSGPRPAVHPQAGLGSGAGYFRLRAAASRGRTSRRTAGSGGRPVRGRGGRRTGSRRFQKTETGNCPVRRRAGCRNGLARLRSGAAGASRVIDFGRGSRCEAGRGLGPGGGRSRDQYSPSPISGGRPRAMGQVTGRVEDQSAGAKLGGRVAGPRGPPSGGENRLGKGGRRCYSARPGAGRLSPPRPVRRQEGRDHEKTTGRFIIGVGP